MRIPTTRFIKAWLWGVRLRYNPSLRKSVLTRQPRLTLRLAIATALALSFGVVGIFLLVRQRATLSAERDAEGSARLVAEGILRRQLTPSDLAMPANPDRARKLDAAVFAPLKATRGVLRASIFATNGRIVYSSTASLVGTVPTDLDKVKVALSGRTSREVSRLSDDEGGGDPRRVLEVYVPIFLGSGKPTGVFEVYEDYARVSEEVGRTIVPVGLVLGLGALGLFGSLFPMLRGVTRTLEQRNRRMQEQAAELQQSQKLEAVGQLAAGIAHDFNNVLTAVRGYSQLLHLELAPDDPRRVLSEKALFAIDRATAISGRLLSFSRREVVALRVADINDIVRHTEALLRPAVDPLIEVEIALHPEPLWIEGDPGQLEQAILNLVLNAGDAMPGGGVLTITTAPAPSVRPPDVPDGDFVCIAVSDTGIGMNDELRTRIFEPFVTTKKDGSGTGLGLASVWRTVTQAHGCVVVESEPRVGSTFTMYLPASTRAPSAVPDAARTEAAVGAGETVLVVEDDPSVRDLVAQLLRDNGYRVVVAEDGARGLAVADEQGGDIDLVVSDVKLPWVSGPELAGMLREGRPDLPVVFISGHVGDELNIDVLQGSPTWFLPKPFGRVDLLMKVREALTDISVHESPGPES